MLCFIEHLEDFDMAMIERLAEAMRLRAIERGHPIHPVMAHHLAAAAIEAMREPTEDMYRAVDDSEELIASDGRLNPHLAVNAWKLMIDTALGEPTPAPDQSDYRTSNHAFRNRP
jgi:hypothetical protein